MTLPRERKGREAVASYMDDEDDMDAEDEDIDDIDDEDMGIEDMEDEDAASMPVVCSLCFILAVLDMLLSEADALAEAVLFR